ncbi:uncharacterized protein [Temnothorax longispinosus]|uniref:uncharacterized protein n=1 Tax=Temnothorax longispinosus TaxID=300112 RepID=UPI003A99D42D
MKEMFERRIRRQKRVERPAKELARHDDQQTDKTKKCSQEETVAQDEPKKKRKRLNDTADDASTSKDISKKDLNEKPLSKRELKKKKATLAKLEKKKDKEIRAINMAYIYLKKWKHCKNEWKFEKLRQIWLIDNLLSSYSISDEIFPIVLEYFEKCRGSARETLIEKAMELMKKAEAEEDEKDKKELMKTTPYKRARQVLQTLSPSEEI